MVSSDPVIRSRPPGIWRLLLPALAALLFCYGAWLRWKDGFVAITTSDSLEYLQGALTGDLNQVAWRTFVYPLFLKICVERLGGLGAAVALQKFLGLLAAGLTFAAWMRLKGAIRYRPRGIVLHDSLGLLLLAMMLIPWGSTRYFELSIMLEATSTFALAAVVFAAGGLLVAVQQPATVRQVPIWAGALVGLSLFANALNPRFSPTVALSFLVAAVALRFSRTGLGRSLVALALPVVLAVPLLVLPQRGLDRQNPWNRTFVPMHFLFMHARLTLPEIQHDRDDPSFTRYDHDFLKRLSAVIEAELARAERDGPGGNYTLLYDPNRLLWGEAGDVLRAYAQGSPERYNEFCRYYFRRALTHRPLAYAKKVVYEWIYLFRPSGPMLDDSWQDSPVALGLAWGAANSGMYVERARAQTRPAFVAYQAQVTDAAKHSTAVFHTPFPLNQLGLWVNRCFFALWLIISAAAGALLWRRRHDPSVRTLCLAFFGASLLLMAQLAPLAFVTTTCGGRAVQGLRTLSAFVTVDLGLMSCVFLAFACAHFRGWHIPILASKDEALAKSAG